MASESNLAKTSRCIQSTRESGIYVSKYNKAVHVAIVVRYTGIIYQCPECKGKIEGYIEEMHDGSTEELAGCANCLDCWSVSTLKQLSKEIVQFT